MFQQRRTCLSKKMKNSGTNGLKPIGEIQIGTNFSIGKKPLKSSVVCKIHFKESDYIRNNLW
jgi:hypothetical protein